MMSMLMISFDYFDPPPDNSLDALLGLFKFAILRPIVGHILPVELSHWLVFINISSQRIQSSSYHQTWTLSLIQNLKLFEEKGWKRLKTEKSDKSRHVN